MIMSLEMAQKRYGLIKDGKWSEEANFCGTFSVPEVIACSFINSLTSLPARHIYCNKDMHQALDAAMENVINSNLEYQLKTFDGAFEIRDVRGEPGKPSCHSYGLAIDINAAENKLGEEPTISQELVKCFTDAGFTWGGGFHRKDGMHFSYAWE